MYSRLLSTRLCSLILICTFQLATLNAFAQSYNITDLGSLGGSSTMAHAINVAGQVTGFSNLSNNTAGHAFLYQGGTMADLGTLGGQTSLGNTINISGRVAGYSTKADGKIGRASCRERV